MSVDIQTVTRNQMLTRGSNEACMQFACNVDARGTLLRQSGTDISSVCGGMLWHGVTCNRRTLGGGAFVKAYTRQSTHTVTQLFHPAVPLKRDFAISRGGKFLFLRLNEQTIGLYLNVTLSALQI